MTEAVAQPETFRGLAGRCWLSWSASIAVIAATLAVFSYTLVDQPVAWWAYTHLPPGTRGQHFFDEMTHFGSSGPWLLGAGVAFVICLVLGLRRRAADAALVFAAVAAAGLLVNVVKAILGRARPEALFLHDLYGFEFFHTNYALTGFPSGHSATIGAAATVLTLFWPKLWPEYLCPDSCGKGVRRER